LVENSGTFLSVLLFEKGKHRSIKLDDKHNKIGYERIEKTDQAFSQTLLFNKFL